MNATIHSLYKFIALSRNAARGLEASSQAAIQHWISFERALQGEREQLDEGGSQAKTALAAAALSTPQVVTL